MIFEDAIETNFSGLNKAVVKISKTSSENK
jgi:hypothetical protein